MFDLGKEKVKFEKALGHASELCRQDKNWEP